MARAEKPKRERRTEAIAHRGLSGRAPENTLSAFELAIECGADRVEFDVLLTKDGVPVVIHDALLDRTTDGRGPVCERTLAEIQALDAGSWFGSRFAGQRIPTLDATLLACRGRIALNVEIKEEAVARGEGKLEDGIESKVVAAIRRHGLVETTIVSSFEPLALERVKALDGGLIRETLYNRADRPPALADLESAQKAGSACLNISREELAADPTIVRSARRYGLGIKVYTVDDPAEWPPLIDLGIAGIFTNFADALSRLVREAPSGL